jgi:hypothetical protein
MGYIRHHAIVVTGGEYGPLPISIAHKRAVEMFGDQVSSMIVGCVNSYQTFVIGPDGSKEGWPESDEGDERRKAFKAFMDSRRYEDGSSVCSWVEVQYGDDNLKTKIVSHSDEPRRCKAKAH